MRVAYTIAITLIAGLPAYGQASDQGQHRQVTAQVMGCPDLAYEDVTYDAIDREVENHDIAGKASSIAAAERLGCTVFGPGLTGVVITNSHSSVTGNDFDEMKMDWTQRDFWVPAVAIGPVDPSKSIYAPYPSNP